MKILIKKYKNLSVDKQIKRKNRKLENKYVISANCFSNTVEHCDKHYILSPHGHKLAMFDWRLIADTDEVNRLSFLRNLILSANAI